MPGRTFYEAGVLARQRMAQRGLDVENGETWAFNELTPEVLEGAPGARAEVLEFMRGLYDGAPGMPKARGIVFNLWVPSTTDAAEVAAYKTNLRAWLTDEAFWSELDRYVDVFAHEVYVSALSWGVGGTELPTQGEATERVLPAHGRPGRRRSEVLPGGPRLPPPDVPAAGKRGLAAFGNRRHPSARRQAHAAVRLGSGVRAPAVRRGVSAHRPAGIDRLRLGSDRCSSRATRWKAEIGSPRGWRAPSAPQRARHRAPSRMRAGLSASACCATAMSPAPSSTPCGASSTAGSSVPRRRRAVAWSRRGAGPWPSVLRPGRDANQAVCVTVRRSSLRIGDDALNPQTAA